LHVAPTIKPLTVTVLIQTLVAQAMLESTVKAFAYKKNTNTYCSGNITACAQAHSVDMSSLCSEKTRKEVANANWDWLMAILVIKCVGLVFLIALEIRSLCNSRKKANERDRDREPGEEDVEATAGCCEKCKHCSWESCKHCMTSTVIFTLKLFFLIFGTVATTLAIWLLLYTNRVTFSSCHALSNHQSYENCLTVEDNCTFGDGQNYYIVVFGNLNLTGPYIVDLVTSASTTILWIVRFAVLRYYLGQTKLTSV